MSTPISRLKKIIEEVELPSFMGNVVEDKDFVDISWKIRGEDFRLSYDKLNKLYTLFKGVKPSLSVRDVKPILTKLATRNNLPKKEDLKSFLEKTKPSNLDNILAGLKKFIVGDFA